MRDRHATVGNFAKRKLDKYRTTPLVARVLCPLAVAPEVLYMQLCVRGRCATSDNFAKQL